MKWHPPLLPPPQTLTIEEIEARLLEQEHRPLAAFRNLITNWRNYPKGDPRRGSILLSVIYCTLFSTSAVAAAGAVVGLATIGLLYWQNEIARKSNELLNGQLTLQQNQLNLQERARLKSEQLAALKELYSESHHRLRSVAFESYVECQQALHAEQATTFTGINLKACGLLETKGISFVGCNFDGAFFLKLSSCHFTKGTWNQLFFSGVFTNCHFIEIDFRETRYFLATFKNCTFDRCIFGKCTDNARPHFKDCGFKGESFLKGSDNLLLNSRFSGANHMYISKEDSPKVPEILLGNSSITVHYEPTYSETEENK